MNLLAAAAPATDIALSVILIGFAAAAGLYFS